MQAKLALARKKGQDVVIHNGKSYKAGTTTSAKVTKVTPAVTQNVPAINRTVTKETPNFKKRKIKLRSRKGGLEAISTNARVKNR